MILYFTYSIILNLNQFELISLSCLISPHIFHFVESVSFCDFTKTGYLRTSNSCRAKKICKRISVQKSIILWQKLAVNI